MPTPWLNKIRRTGQLTVHNLGGTWAPAVDSALAKFNTLGLPVKLAAEKNKDAANVVVKFSEGAETYPYNGPSYTASAKANFDAKLMHGQTSTMADADRHQIFFAVIFLPGKIMTLTTEQKELITIHEFIHACGLDGGLGNGTHDKKGQDHDTVGIQVAQLKVDGRGLIEYMPEKNAKGMYPVRIGAQTICKLQRIWTAGGCQED